MNQSAYIPYFPTIVLQPHPAQFAIDELPMLLLCPVGLAYGGMEKPLASVTASAANSLSASGACSCARWTTWNCTAW